MTFFRVTVLTIVFAIMIVLTGVNLTFSNVIGETCGVLHPYIFETQVIIIDPDTGRNWTSVSNLPTGEDDELDTHLRIYDEAGNLLRQNDDYLGLESSGIVDFRVSEAQTIIVEVATYEDAFGGRYKLELIDTPDNLSEIYPKLNMDLSHNAEIKADDRNRYILDVVAGEEISISVRGFDAQGFELDTYLRIYNDANQVIAENDDFDGIHAGITPFTVDEDSTVIIEVATYRDTGEGRYDILVEPYISETITDEEQANDELTILAGASISLDELLINDIALGSRIRHTLNLQSGQMVDIFLSGDLDTYLRIYDEAGELIAENDDYGGFNSAIIRLGGFAEDTTLIIEAGTFDDFAEGQYQLLVEENNLQYIEAATLDIGTMVSGNITPDTRIRHHLDLTMGQMLTFSLTAQDEQGEALHSYLRLYNEFGQIISESYNPEDFNAIITHFEAYEDMTIIAEVSTYDDAGQGVYQLSVEEFQLDIATGEQIQIASSLNYQIETGQRSQHALSLEAGQSVIIALKGDLDTYLRIYDEMGELLAQNDDLQGVNAGLVGFSVDEDSIVIVEVATFGDVAEGTYELSVDLFSWEVAQEILNLNISEGVALLIEKDIVEETIFGEINEGQRIHHNLNLQREQWVNIFLYDKNLEDEVLDTYLRIYDQSGNLLAENDDFEDLNSAIIRVGGFSENTTTIIVEVATYADSGVGAYELFVETNHLKINDVKSISVDETVIGSIEPEQRFRYTLDLEADRSISFFLGYDDTPQEINLSELLGLNADDWVSCLEYYGHVVESVYVINGEGLVRFVGASKLEVLCDFRAGECILSAQNNLTPLGQLFFFVILPGFAIILPIITVFMLKGNWEVLWFISLILVATYVLTSALLYVHLGTVSGITALSEFAYGMFGGTATGAAIAFMTKVMDNFSIDRSEDKDEQAKAILKIIEEKLSDSIEE